MERPSEISLIFIFFTQGTRYPLPEEIQNRIRRELAEVFSLSGFGEVLMDENHYATEYAQPTMDRYDAEDHTLHISFRFLFPLAHGNLGELIGGGLDRLRMFVNNERRNFQNLNFMFNMAMDEI